MSETDAAVANLALGLKLISVAKRLVKYEDDRYQWIYTMDEQDPDQRMVRGDALDAEYAAIVKLAREIVSSGGKL